MAFLIVLQNRPMISFFILVTSHSSLIELHWRRSVQLRITFEQFNRKEHKENTPQRAQCLCETLRNSLHSLRLIKAVGKRCQKIYT